MTLRDVYQQYVGELSTASKAASKIDETQVYQEANPETRKYVEKLMGLAIPKESTLGNIENFKAFYDAVTKEGKHGLILMEHYSNLDLPEFIYLLENQGEEWAKDLASRIVAIAGMKLNEASDGVRAFSESFTRVVIYPTRSLTAFKDKDISDAEKEEEDKRARKINFAAMRAMDQCKKKGQVILVFPAGTRYRPGQPETKQGLREIDSYLRLFDIMLLVSINGNCLKIDPNNPNDMLADILTPEKVTLTASEVIECKPFRNNILEKLPEDDPDPKQKTINRVMEILDEMHEKYGENNAN